MNEAPQDSRGSLPPSPVEAGEQLIRGQLTPAQYLGLSQKRLYEIATLGYSLMEEGRFKAALELFQGLVAASPYDSVFHCHLAATYAQLERLPEALEAFNQALQLNIANVDALVGRSELFLLQGKLTEALLDIQAALQFDPEAQRETTQRARTTLAMLQMMAGEVVEG